MTPEATVNQFFQTIQPSFGGRYGVAVSGGGDSVALLHLMYQALGPEKICILHFNHDLREEARMEACWVRRLATRLQIPYFAHEWQGYAAGNMQQAARIARYAFFAEIARRNNLTAIALGHTRDDVVENLLMRLGRGSGVTGLAAIKADTSVQNVRILRPMLDIERSTLRTYLKAKQQPWLEDPTNQNQHYLRPRVRQGIATLTQMGFTEHALADTAASLRRVEDALVHVTESVYQAFSRPGDVEGSVVLSQSVFNQPDEIAQRVLEKVILTLKPAPMAPRLSKRLRLVEAMRQQTESPSTATLGGVQFRHTDAGILCQPLN